MNRTSLTHRICALLIACWIPFCCCTLKAAAVMAAGPSAEGAPLTFSCCSQSSCSKTSDQNQNAPLEDGPCTDCCIKVSPEAPCTPDFQIDEIGREIPSIEAIKSTWLHHANNDLLNTQKIPPDPPPADLVALHCQLLVRAPSIACTPTPAKNVDVVCLID